MKCQTILLKWFFGLKGAVYYEAVVFGIGTLSMAPLVFVLTGFDYVCFRLPALGCFY